MTIIELDEVLDTLDPIKDNELIKFYMDKRKHLWNKLQKEINKRIAA